MYCSVQIRLPKTNENAVEWLRAHKHPQKRVSPHTPNIEATANLAANSANEKVPKVYHPTALLVCVKNIFRMQHGKDQ